MAHAIWYCACHPEDELFFNEFKRHVSALAQNHKITIEGDPTAPPGESRSDYRIDRLARAQLLILFVSVRLTTSKEWHDVWEPICTKRSSLYRGRIVPISVGSVDLTDTPLADWTLLSGGVPIGGELNRDSAWTKAVPELRKIAEELKQIPFGDIQTQSAEAYQLTFRGKGSEAIRKLVELRAVLEKYPKTDSLEKSIQLERAHLRDRLAHSEYTFGHFSEAGEQFEDAFKIRTHIASQYPNDPDVLFDLSTSHFWRGHLYYLLGDLSRARDAQARGVDICKQLVLADPNNPEPGRSLVVLETDLGTTLQEMQLLSDAENALRAALERARDQVAKHPDDYPIKRGLAVALFRLANLLVQKQQPTDAENLCLEAVSECLNLVARDHGNLQWRRHLATARMGLADARSALGHLSLSRSDYEFAVGTMGALTLCEPGDLQGWRHYGRSERALGDLFMKEHEYSLADAAYQRAAGAFERVAAAPSPRYHRELTDVYKRQILCSPPEEYRQRVLQKLELWTKKLAELPAG
ncbi:MAG: hypothetical protein IPK82_43825 [Polyangiaceae bacterium]|nr:hypothetical protein [Polyangiaceae bacterium]